MNVNQYNKYIINTDKTYIKLVEYIRKHAELDLKDDLKPFWRQLNPIFDSQAQAVDVISNYLLKCTLSSTPMSLDADILNYILVGDYNTDFNNDFSGGF